MLRRSKFSRRRLGKSAAGAVLTALVRPGASPAVIEMIASSPEPNKPGLTSAQMQELEARFQETLRRYGDLFSEEQNSRIRRVLVDNERMLAAIRGFPLDNGDAPATTLKLHIEDASATEHE